MLDANDLAFLHDHIRVDYFILTGLLMDYIKSDADDDINPQGVITTIFIFNSYVNTDTDSNIDFVSPSESFAPETEHNNDPNDADMQPDRVGDGENAENDMVVEEDEGEHLLSTEIVDEVEDFDSDDELVF